MDFNVLGPGALPPGFGAGFAAGLKIDSATVEFLLRAVTAALDRDDQSTALRLLAADIPSAQLLRDHPALVPVATELRTILAAALGDGRQETRVSLLRSVEAALGTGDRTAAVRLIASHPEFAAGFEIKSSLAPIREEVRDIADGVRAVTLPLKDIAAALASGDRRQAIILAEELLAANPAIGEIVHNQRLPAALRELLEGAGWRRGDFVAPQFEAHATPEIQQLLATVDRQVSLSAPETPVTGAALPHLTMQARAGAETSLLAATVALQSGNAPIPETPANPQTVLGLANQLFERGDYLNYLRAAELGKLIVSWHSPSKAQRQKTPVDPERKAKPLIRLWKRAPMLVLLSGWLAAGIAGAVVVRIIRAFGHEASFPLDVWGLGFIALVGFQFYVTIRNARF